MAPAVAQLFRGARHDIIDAHPASEAEAGHYYGMQVIASQVCLLGGWEFGSYRP